MKITAADFDDDMPAEIDFTGGTRGMFHRTGAAMRSNNSFISARGSWTSTRINNVPEPGTLALVLLSLGGLGLVHRMYNPRANKG